MYLDQLKYNYKDINLNKLDVLMFNVELEIKLRDDYEMFNPEIKDELDLVLFYLENNRNNINNSIFNDVYGDYYALILELIEFIQSKVN